MKTYSKGEKVWESSCDDEIDAVELYSGYAETLVIHLRPEHKYDRHKVRVMGSDGTWTDYLVTFSEDDIGLMRLGRNPYPKKVYP